MTSQKQSILQIDLKPYHEIIVKGRLDGQTCGQIVDFIQKNHNPKVTAGRVYKYVRRHGIPKKADLEGAWRSKIRFGSLKLTENLTPEQGKKLEDLAIKWRCETLSEAILEIVRDALDEI